jgi:Outer membrane protein beta-barrel domain
MRKCVILLFLFVPVFVYSQFGVKAGLNFANVTNASAINSKSQTGFHAGVFLSPSSKSILGSRTELLFSRQGYDYTSGTTTGNVKLDYILLAQMMAINITKYVQIQLGGQTAFMISAKADSSKPATGNATANNILSFYNRFDYGFGAGVEIHPVGGLAIGARYTISLSKLYKQPDANSAATYPSFIPTSNDINLKNNVVMIFVGWKFGKEDKSEKSKHNNKEQHNN